jgi:hypothetical protein
MTNSNNQLDTIKSLLIEVTQLTHFNAIAIQSLTNDIAGFKLAVGRQIANTYASREQLKSAIDNLPRRN